MPALTGEPPRFDVSFADEEVIRNPHSALKAIRALGPVVYNELLPTGYMVGGFRACQQALGNTLKFRERPNRPIETFGDVMFNTIDDIPRHNAVRGLWQPEFTRDTLREKWSQMITDVVDSRLDPFVDRVQSGATLDADDELVGKIPTLVIAKLMGIPLSDCPQLVTWLSQLEMATTDQTPRGDEVLTAGQQARKSFNEYIAGLIDERRVEMGDDLISMMAASETGKAMAPSRIVAHNTGLLIGATEGPVALMGQCLVILAKYPDQRRALWDNRTLIPQAIDEVLRFESVVQWPGPRFVVNGDAEIDGVTIPEGAMVQPMLGIANRDPSRWERPDEFDIFRDQKSHLGFGFGMHNCLGMTLARLEVEIFLNRLLDRLPEWETIGEPNYTRVQVRRAAPIWIAKA